MNSKAGELVRQILATLRPAEDLKLADWVTKNLTLPEGQSVRPGPMENWPYFTDILNAMGDRGVERVTVMKSARVGYTTALMSVLAATAAMDPCPIILLMPTDDDAHGISVDSVEPIFRANKVLRGLMKFGRLDGRNTIVRKSLGGGGTLKILSARAPRNLRRHDCRLLLCDEVDGYEVTAEGDALDLAERRTMAQPNRKIIVGSTPTIEDISAVAARYERGSQEIFEIPCPDCGAYNAPEWSNLEWENHDPTTVKYMCPHCKALIDERHKPAMVYAGKWQAQRPEITNHRSFKINALVSLLPKAAWATLVAEYYEAKRGGPSNMMVFVNTVLGRPWRTTVHRVDANILADRAEPLGLETPAHGVIIPDSVMLITCGIDMQDDRLEAVVLGFPIYGPVFILGHRVFAGNTLEDGVWKQLDVFLKTRWRHSRGWSIGIDGTAIDSGGREGRTQKAYDFCYPRMHRNIFAIKGQGGPRRTWEKAKAVKGDMRCYNVAIDNLKDEVLDRLSRDPFGLEGGGEDPQAFRFSDNLGDEFYVQITNEVKRRRYVKTRFVDEWQPKKQGAPTEGLDCTVYALAVRQSPSVRSIDLRERAARPIQVGGEPTPAKPSNAGSWAEKFASL